MFPVRLVRALLSALLLLVLAAPVAFGHAELETAEPAPDSRVSEPAVLVTSFDQDLDPSRTSLEVRDAAGDRVVAGGEPGDDPRTFTLDLPTLAPGEYEVRWTSFSAEDGELARGEYTFTVVAAPSPSPSPTAQPTETVTPTSTSTPTPSAPPTVVSSPIASPATATPEPTSTATASDVAIPIIAALVATAGFGWWLLRRRRA